MDYHQYLIQLLAPSRDSINSKGGPGAVAQWLRSSPCTPWIPYGRWFYPGSPASLPAPCLWPGKAVEDGPKLWDPAPMTGRVSWLRIGIASSIALTWGVNHRTEDLPLCLSSLYIRLSNKKIIIKINLKKKEQNEKPKKIF